MTGIARIGDSINTHHGCSASTTITTTRTGTVFINGIAVAIIGDKTPLHSYGGKNCSASHEITLTNGSSNVFMDGAAVLRIDDTTSGEQITGGSGNVFAN